MVHSARSSSSTNLRQTNGNISPHSPLGILLVSKDESAERVLFMYPFESELTFPGNKPGDDENNSTKSGGLECKDREETGLGQQANNNSRAMETESEIETRKFGLPIKMLAPLLQTKCANEESAPFEIKVDNIRFVGFPWSIEGCGSLCLAVVFILPGAADTHIVEAFQRLSKKIAIAINTEQQRCNYLRDQISLVQPAHDEFEALSDEQRNSRNHHSPYEAILKKSGLAKHLRDIFEDVCEYGMVDVFVDDCIEVGFCVEPKALCHAGLAPHSSAQIESIMARIRPYHGILFLEDSVPSPDSNPFVLRFLEEFEPSRSIEELSLLSGLPLSQVLQIIRHYLLWARAMVIYPICTSNVYTNSERLPANFKALDSAFNEQFPEYQLAEVLEAFSLPCALGSFLQDTAIYFGQPTMYMSMLVFLLRNRLLVQMHTYFYLLPPLSNFEKQQHHEGAQQQTNAANSETGGENEDERDRAEEGEERIGENGAENGQQQTSSQHLSARIRTCIAACKDLDVQLIENVLAICKRLIHVIGIPEPEMFFLVSTFLTFVHFLKGRNHLEDIIHRTHLDRSTVMRVLDTFSDLVCPFYSQDIITEED